MKKKNIVAYYQERALRWRASGQYLLPYFYARSCLNALYNVREISFIRRHVQIFQNDLVLDIGCGPGRCVVEYASRGAILVALDASVNVLKLAREKIRRLCRVVDKENLNFIVGDAEHLPFSDHKFDVVNCFDAFPHFPDPIRSLSEMKRVSKPNGLIVFEPSNIFSLLGIGLYFIRFLCRMLRMKIVPIAWTHWTRFDSPWTIMQWIRCTGLKLEQVVSVGYSIPPSRKFVELFERFETLLENTFLLNMLGSRILFRCRK